MQGITKAGCHVSLWSPHTFCVCFGTRIGVVQVVWLPPVLAIFFDFLTGHLLKLIMEIVTKIMIRKKVRTPHKKHPIITFAPKVLNLLLGRVDDVRVSSDVRLLLPTELRRRLLWRSKCFECQCERCVAEVRVRMIWTNIWQIVEVKNVCPTRKIRCEEWVALSVLKLWNNTRRFQSQGTMGAVDVL